MARLFFLFFFLKGKHVSNLFPGPGTRTQDLLIKRPKPHTFIPLEPKGQLLGDAMSFIYEERGYYSPQTAWGTLCLSMMMVALPFKGTVMADGLEEVVVYIALVGGLWFKQGEG